ncbi:hypothetical protein JAAARDRAFT_54125 [Jaapia argillacea MUCL 33604]|uniref:FMN hydroxy acid dehydrogenase domain-containing protein n=1 Tax=Jaapia argillacea MUCL 33604 TaxID=933084 RepID=A0A067Q4X6_9AGAM|nr:hypothetical protein JAAARDRAFT_54125 [Jaapia argillacea MUCL 33604]
MGEHVNETGLKAAPIVFNKWSAYMRELYASRKSPAVKSLEVLNLEENAKEVLKDQNEAYMYVFGSAGTYSTNRDNRKAFDSWKIIPRMLVNASERHLQTTIFGVKYPSPLLLAPIGVQGIVSEVAESASARAAERLEVPFIMSSASTRCMEELAKDNGDGHRWYQLYWPKSDDITISLLNRAKAHKFTALVVTLDTMLLGWRPYDLDKAYLPFHDGVGIQNATADPVFMSRFGLKPVYDYHPAYPYVPADVDAAVAAGDKGAEERTFLGREWIKEANSGSFKDWNDLKVLRDNWEGPIVLKGIQRVEDAEMAVDAGIEGIIVSNHGGRQVDGAIPSLYALDAICSSPKIKEAQASGKLTVLFDSGIRTGSDIIKATAMGAQAILLGRLYIYGLAIAGQEGVEEVVKSILADTEITLGLIGYKSLDEIRGRRDILQKIEL